MNIINNNTPLPSLDLLSLSSADNSFLPDVFEQLDNMAEIITSCLASHQINVMVVDSYVGPIFTRFELSLAPGTKVSTISRLSNELARALSAISVRIIEAIPDKQYVGLDILNQNRQKVHLRDVIDCVEFRDSVSPLTMALGTSITGQPISVALTQMPHLLVVGATGAGKSVSLHAMILSMLYKSAPDALRFIMIDTKILELSVYNGIPHLLAEVITDISEATQALRWCIGEMKRRYSLMAAFGVRNLADYNKRIFEAEAIGRPIPDPFARPEQGLMPPSFLTKEPLIAIIIDEFSELIRHNAEELFIALTQQAHAAGIHLILSTRNLLPDVITNRIKVGIPARIAFALSSKADSRMILDQDGAESLLGDGDMLYLTLNTSTPLRIHGAFVRDEEIHAVVNDWKSRGRPSYIHSIVRDISEVNFDGEEELDPLFDQAVAFVIDKRRASISGIQREFRIGYNRAARIVEQMEVASIVSAPGHNGNREVLTPPLFE